MRFLESEWDQPKGGRMEIRYTPGDPQHNYRSYPYLFLSGSGRPVSLFADEKHSEVPRNLLCAVMDTKTGEVTFGEHHLLRLGFCRVSVF